MIAAQVTETVRDRFLIGEAPRPTPGADDVVVQVHAAGLAPGIFNLLRAGRVPLFPTILGHEIAGEVVELGSDADPALLGRRVRVHPSLSCGHCEYCTSDRDMMCSANSIIGHAVFGPDAMSLYKRYHNGGLAQFTVVPQSYVDPLPDSISYDLGAKVHDFGNAIRALKLAELPPASTLIVTAATGGMGTATISLAREFGVSKIIAVGRNADRLKDIAALDDRVATVRVSDDDPPHEVVAAIRALAPGGAHAVLDYFPDGPGLAKVFGAIRFGGRIVHMGMSPAPFAIPQIAVAVACVSFIGNRNGTRADALDAIRILAADPARYERLITHRFVLADANAAREALESRRDPLWMAVVNPEH